MTDAEKLDMAIGYIKGDIRELRIITGQGNAYPAYPKSFILEVKQEIESLVYAVKVLEKARRDG